VARPIVGASLLEVRRLLEESDAVVCNDSGLLHVSVRLGRETVLLCGGEVFEVWCDYQVRHLHPLRHAVDCYPCRLWTCSHQSCLAGISVERVTGELRGILAGEKSTSR
jgi:heptosyltransferase-2